MEWFLNELNKENIFGPDPDLTCITLFYSFLMSFFYTVYNCQFFENLQEKIHRIWYFLLSKDTQIIKDKCIFLLIQDFFSHDKLLKRQMKSYFSHLQHKRSVFIDYCCKIYRCMIFSVSPFNDNFHFIFSMQFWYG